MSPQTDFKKAEGTVLCLSGGGFRATLFHLGALRRLNELGVLTQLSVITSVSGGSILNGLLAANWDQLPLQSNGTLGRFDEVIATPMRTFCTRDLRTDLLVGTRLNPANWPLLFRDFFSVRANFLAGSYNKLYKEAWLSGVPAPQPGKAPRFVFCSTSVQTGACWHFHSGPDGRMGDFYTGYMKTGRTSIAQAVAASSAFPPGFGALRLPIEFPDAFDRVDPWGKTRPPSDKRVDLPLNGKRLVLLTDGGVYDNLGVEPVWDRFSTLLVSDAGHPFSSQANCRQAAISRLWRAADISAQQVGAVRKRWFMEKIRNAAIQGTIWAIDTNIEDYKLADARGYGPDSSRLLQKVRTDLNTFSEGEMNCLENHGYSLADAAMRSYGLKLCPIPHAPFQFPHPVFSKDAPCVQLLAQSANRKVLRGLGRYLVDRFKEDWLSPARKLLR